MESHEQPLLTVNMIVRDEAAMLPRFLAAAEGLWDQLAVLDTGSVDDTVSILEAAGAELERAEWPGDFSKARNQALQHARGTWVLVLDADEIVTPQFVAEIRELLLRDDVGAATITMRNLFSTGHHRDSRLLRLFRRDESIRYRHAIHEEVAESVADYLRKTGRHLAHVSSPVEHLGYLRSRAAEKEKKDRDREILERSVVAEPSDLYSRFKLLELARFWADSELGTQVSSECLSGLREGGLSLEGSHVGGELLVLAARVREPQDPAAALRLIDEFAADCLPSPAFHLGRGELRELTGDPAGAEDDFRACLTMEDPTLQVVTTRPLMALARLALAQGRPDDALPWIDEALRHSPFDQEALLAAVSFRLHRPGEAEAFVAEQNWTPALASAVETSVEIAAVSLLREGRVEEAHARMAGFVEQCPLLGVGMLVCDLVLGRNTDLELDVELAEADAALRRWVETLSRLGDPDLVSGFVANAPSLASVFPWLGEFGGPD